MRKTFVLDTNVLIHDNQAMYSFADNKVVIPMTVIEELDKLKTFHDEKGYNARQAARTLEQIFMNATKKSSGAFLSHTEAPLGDGLIAIETKHNSALPDSLDLHKNDNKILGTALYLQKEKKEKVIFVSKDLNARLKGRALNLEVHDYEKAKVQYEDLYKGWIEAQVDDNEIDRFYKEHVLPFSVLNLENMVPNSFFILKSKENEKKSALAKLDFLNQTLVPLDYQGDNIWGITSLNVQQRFAFDLLLNEKVKVISLLGKAGTGKTLIAIAAALKQTLEDKLYKKVLVARPIIPLGKDIGYLPGSKDEKLSVWMEPIFDNMYFLLSQNKKDEHSMKEVKEELHYLFDSNLVELGAITYIRGRSIPQQFVIIDEAQNLTPHEIKTIVSRIGEKSKIILTGDPEQIDNPYLDQDSNGLSYLVEKFKGQEIFGHVNLVKSERSTLASLASELL